MKDFIEIKILGAVRRLLTGRINELLGELEFPIPPIEFSEYRGGAVIVPAIVLSGCERTEKERIVKLDAYSLTIRFTLPEATETELFCYAYADAVCRAIEENPTLGGAADRAAISGKKYNQPNKPHCGGGWEAVISLRITVEGMRN